MRAALRVAPWRRRPPPTDASALPLSPPPSPQDADRKKEVASAIKAFKERAKIELAAQQRKENKRKAEQKTAKVGGLLFTGARRNSVAGGCNDNTLTSVCGSHLQTPKKKKLSMEPSGSNIQGSDDDEVSLFGVTSA